MHPMGNTPDVFLLKIMYQAIGIIEKYWMKQN